MNLLDNYKTEALKTVKNFQNDIDIDLEFVKIELEQPGNSGHMLFFLRNSGTYFMPLTKYTAEKLPRAGEKVKYLFSYCSRREIVENSIYGMLPTLKQPYFSEKILLMDIKKQAIREIKFDDAAQLAKTWAANNIN